MIKSDFIYREVVETFKTVIPVGLSVTERAARILEFELFRDSKYTAHENPIDFTHNDDGSTVLSFRGVYEMSGTSYNSQIYPDAVYADTSAIENPVVVNEILERYNFI